MGFEVHWRAPLQPKGFLKIVEFILAIIAFSLVAGFSVTTSIDFDCLPGDLYNYTFQASYPFRKFEETVIHISDVMETKSTSMVTVQDGGIPRSAEYFVAWGVLTLFYCIIAVLVYMLVTANERWEKAFDFLIIVDIVFHVVWILCWFIASVDWAVASHKLDNYLDDYIDDLKSNNCLNATVNELDRDEVIYVQAQIAVVFGFLIQFVWAVNIGWLVIDTSWYINWKATRGHARI